MKNKLTWAVIYALSLMISACGDSTNATDGDPGGAMVFATSTAGGAAVDLPIGDIVKFGALTIGDERGITSDMVAGFFELTTGVDIAYFSDLIQLSSVHCDVDSDVTIDFSDISVGYIPNLGSGINKMISAGESITVSASGGSYTEIVRQTAGSFLFYDIPDREMLPVGPLPSSLLVDIPGDKFPAFSGVSLADVEALVSVEYGDENTIDPNTIFTWEPGTTDNAQIRIVSRTAGGFFLEDSKTVTCIVPDTGNFSYPTDIRNALGVDFRGSAPTLSRIATRMEVTGDAVFFLVRESFE